MYDKDDIEIIKEFFLDNQMQKLGLIVCAPADIDHDLLTTLTNAVRFCGTSNGWKLAVDRNDMIVGRAENSEKRHYLFVC